MKKNKLNRRLISITFLIGLSLLIVLSASGKIPSVSSLIEWIRWALMATAAVLNATVATAEVNPPVAVLFVGLLVGTTLRFCLYWWQQMKGLRLQLLQITQRYLTKSVAPVASVMELMIQEKTAKQNRISLVLLLAFISYYAIGFVFDLNLPVGVPGVVMLLFIFLWADHKRLVARMVKGEYGSSEQEARAMITFILNHSSDYKGGGGRRRIKLTPEEIAKYTQELETQLELEGVS